jgi:hypothetical protein
MTPDEMKQAIEKDKAERAQLCMDEIQAALDEHKCRLVPTPQIQDGRIVAVLQLVAE